MIQKTTARFARFSYPDYFWFWSSYFVSNVGSWMQSIAMGWLLFDLTASPLYLGLFSSLRMVMLLSFFIIGGIMSDRIDRRKVMLWIQFIAAGTSLVLALLVSSHTIQVWHIFVLGAVTSTTWAFEQPVRQALLPQLVPRDVLVNALALNAVTWNGAGLLGPSLVGISVGTIGIDGCFYVNVVSYLAVVAALLRLRVPANVQEPGAARCCRACSADFATCAASRSSSPFWRSRRFSIFSAVPMSRFCRCSPKKSCVSAPPASAFSPRVRDWGRSSVRLPWQVWDEWRPSAGSWSRAACFRGGAVRLRREPQFLHRRRALGCHRRLEHGI